MIVLIDGLGLWVPGERGRNLAREAFRPDWLRLQTTGPGAKRQDQPLVKALASQVRRGQNLTVLDAMGGFGEDAWLMAGLGHRVVTVERCPPVYALLRDAWARAACLHYRRALRIRPMLAEAGQVLGQLAGASSRSSADRPDLSLLPRPDVVYLDPMFPQATKRKSAERKAMRSLRSLLGLYPEEPAEPEELVQLALQAASNRVVVKRPLRAAAFSARSARVAHSVEGKSVRYDVYAG
jgi:16S rRNA (guanine1516-N2)-methyltransferase